MRIRTFTIQPPRNPLLRALALVAGAVITAALLVLGLIVGAVVVTGAAAALLVRRWFGHKPAAASDDSIIEGEYTVVSPRRTGLPHAD
ncbi:MAG TPA: hypothetical protein VFL63_12685 [Rhodanobacteraceae bacterium]|jgi:hypothetical protein|nr:hypothetical protein [Rhodanobacteraceae bacterium]